RALDQTDIIRDMTADDGKLIATQPCHKLIRLHDALKIPREQAQYSIASEVPIPIIDEFEVVHVQDHQANGIMCRGKAASQLLDKTTPVRQARQFIFIDLTSKLFCGEMVFMDIFDSAVPLNDRIKLISSYLCSRPTPTILTMVYDV